MKMLLVLTAAAAFAGPCYAADLSARVPLKAPPPAPVANWTGFYVFGGGGGGIWDADTFTSVTATRVPLSVNQRTGGDGWFGTVGAGYDWQYHSNWVFGIFADGQFGSLRGTIQDPVAGLTGTIKMEDAWAAGGRAGYLVAPNVLSYVNAGYSGSHWSRTELLSTFSGLPVGVHTNSFNRNGWFVGGGVENNLSIFGITAPGWFMKTEYRAAFYGNNTGSDRNGRVLNELVDGTNALVGRDINFKPYVQTISTSLVYRFNWGGPLIARY